jgi:membrane-associated phospholipid phosphatase
MRKGSIVCLICVFLFFQGFSQSDSLPSPTRHVITKDSASVIPKYGAEIKAIPDKKESVYKLKPGVDIPIIAAGTGWSLYAFTKIYNKPHPDTVQIQNLNSDNINALDRGLMYPYSKSMDDVSYYPFYAAMPLPLIFFLSDKETRSDFFKLTFLYWEAMSVTGLLGTNATFHVDRYRPYSYFHDSHGTMDNGAPIGVVKNSFYAGHVQIVATPTFFLAKVYADYHPDSKIKWVFYGVASAATVSMAYMRIKAGEHFPSDVLLGAATGALAGILVPQFHKTKSTKAPAMGIMPYSSGATNGLVLIYNFKK